MEEASLEEQKPPKPAAVQETEKQDSGKGAKGKKGGGKVCVCSATCSTCAMYALCL